MTTPSSSRAAIVLEGHPPGLWPPPKWNKKTKTQGVTRDWAGTLTLTYLRAGIEAPGFPAPHTAGEAGGGGGPTGSTPAMVDGGERWLALIISQGRGERVFKTMTIVEGPKQPSVKGTICVTDRKPFLSRRNF